MKTIPREAHGVATNSSAIRTLRKSLSLNEKQRETLIGSLLGDGCLIANSWGKNYRLKMEQCDNQKKYLFWKYEIFKNFTLQPPKYQATTNSWSFRTISHPEFTAFRDLFYPKGKKSIPNDFEKILTSQLSLAIWFMDDGSLNTRKDSFILNTQSFTKDDNEKLKECLALNFSIQTTLNRDKSYWRLYVSKKSAQHFQDLTKELVTALMSKKLLVAP